MTTVHMQLSKWTQESQASSDTPDMGKKSVTRLPAVSSMYSATYRYRYSEHTGTVKHDVSESAKVFCSTIVVHVCCGHRSTSERCECFGSAQSNAVLP